MKDETAGCSPGAGVKEEKVAAGNNSRAGLRAVRVRDRRSGADQEDVHPSVRQKAALNSISKNLGAVPDAHVLKRRMENNQEYHENRKSRKENRCLFFHLFISALFKNPILKRIVSCRLY